MSAWSTTKSRHSDRRRLRRKWSDTARSWRSPERNNWRRAPPPMASEPFMRRYQNCYARLLRLDPGPYRERFGDSMEQTFNDLCRERVKAERGLFGFALWIFAETSAAIIRENAASI